MGTEERGEKGTEKTEESSSGTLRNKSERPLVSICLPSLNSLPYLKERISTIYDQTYSNWEIIVVDSFSEDGSWELFEDLARTDKRVSISQAPRGLYAGWNECVRRARGKYVYIATSDDTMAPDCLEKLVDALEEHEECDLAHCNLVIIDEAGEPVESPRWPDCTSLALDDPEVVGRMHVRQAPYDGLLHLMGSMVYLSITQLLIRRSLFSRIGYFDARWGAMGDRNWEMKAGLVANTVHVPQTWATWRVYPHQASASLDVYSIEHARHIDEMIEDALAKCEASLPPEVLEKLRTDWRSHSQEMRTYYSNLRLLPSVLRRRVFQFTQLLLGRRAAWREVTGILRRQPKWTSRGTGEIKAWLESAGLRPIVECTTSTRNSVI